MLTPVAQTLQFIHKSLNTVQYEMNNEFEESVWVEAKFNLKDKLLIGCICRSPSSSERNNDQLH